MKKSIIAVSVLFAAIMSAGALAKGMSEEGMLYIKGVVKESTCKIVGDNDNATIKMPDVSVAELMKENANVKQDRYSSTSRGEIKFQCSEGKTPTISFAANGFNDKNSNITKNTETEDNGVGFMVYLNGEPNPINPRESIKLTNGVNGLYSLDFSAFYVRTSDNVTAGMVNSTITMQVFSD